MDLKRSFDDCSHATMGARKGRPLTVVLFIKPFSALPIDVRTAAIQIYVSTFNSRPRNECWTWGTASRYLNSHNAKLTITVISYTGQTVTGFAIGTPAKYHHVTKELPKYLVNRRTYYISVVAVRKFTRNRGVGTILIRKMLRAAAKTGYHKFLCRTRADAIPARNLFETIGFNAILSYISTIGGDTSDRVIYGKPNVRKL